MSDSSRPTAAVIGAGPSGLIAAEVLAAGGAAVTVYDRMPSAGRKLLMAGRGGLNLTHSEDAARFRARYREASAALAPALDAFGPAALRAWSEELGQPTFIGTSGRVFPRAMKASPLLRAWLRRLDDAGVELRLNRRWTGWSPDGALTFDSPQGPVAVSADATVLALGGASWPRLGSDGGWVPVLESAGLSVAPLRPSNCGFLVEWSAPFRERFAGAPLKRVALTFADETVRGEAVVTSDGIEGGAVYALAAPLREAIARDGGATLRVNLCPDLGVEALQRRLAMPRGKLSLSNALRRAIRLAPVEIGLLHEACLSKGRKLGERTPDEIAALVAALPLRLAGIAPLASAISTAGGVAWPELDAELMLRRRPGVFAVGEMLDWEAPTGGYLLQATLATGRLAGEGALRWLQRGR
jgi:uncharacterized flavoprotein (TIGR03862 family)